MVPPVPSANRSQRIFVSYSHTDRALVVPIVQVLRAANDWVFFDVDSIRGGDRWREAIRESLRDADLVVVFWCHHSQASSEVADEYRQALTLRKRLMPVRLDQTPLAPELEDYQWVDFEHLSDRHSPPDAAPVPTKLTWAHGLAVTLAVVLLVVPFLILSGDSASSEPSAFPWMTVGISSALVVSLGIWLALRHRRQTDDRSLRDAQVDGRVVEQLQTAIRDRLRSD